MAYSKMRPIFTIFILTNLMFAGGTYQINDFVENISTELCYPQSDTEWSLYDHFGNVNGGDYKLIWIMLFNASSHVSQIEAEFTESIFSQYRGSGLEVLSAGANWGSNYTCESWGELYSLTYPIIDDTNMNFRALFTDGSVPHHVLLDHQMRVIYTSEGTVIPPTGSQFLGVLENAIEILESLVVVNHLKDWNMVGLPVNVSNASPSNVFPGFVEGTLFSFENTYVNSDELIPGEGYWIHFPYAGHAGFSGSDLTSLTVSLSKGWNIISGISIETDLADISDPGQIIVPGSLYEFDGTYVNSTSVQPGKGYWINAFSDGNVTLSAEGSSEKVKSSFYDYSENANVLHINNRPLYFGVSVPEGELISYQLPPRPPVSAFDIRYDSDNKITGNSGNIKIQNSDKILSIFAEIKIPIDSQSLWVLETPDGRSFNLMEGNTILLEGDINSLTLKKNKILPENFYLYQNFPNPFNPLTTLNFEMPYYGNVNLIVYDLIGNEIRILLDDDLPLGFHSIQWDGTDNMGTPVSAGCYFLQLKITSVNHNSSPNNQFIQTRKIVLLK